MIPHRSWLTEVAGTPNLFGFSGQSTTSSKWPRASPATVVPAERVHLDERVIAGGLGKRGFGGETEKQQCQEIEPGVAGHENPHG